MLEHATNNAQREAIKYTIAQTVARIEFLKAAAAASSSGHEGNRERKSSGAGGGIMGGISKSRSLTNLGKSGLILWIIMGGERREEKAEKASSYSTRIA